jgi:hypothetical protein
MHKSAPSLIYVIYKPVSRSSEVMSCVLNKLHKLCLMYV